MEEKPRAKRRRRKNQKYDISYQPVSLNEAYAKLAVAIVEQACKDAVGYYNGSSAQDKWNREHHGYYQREEVRKFFCDENSLFTLCMPNTDGKTFYKRLIYNYETYGYYCPPDSVNKRGDINL